MREFSFTGYNDDTVTVINITDDQVFYRYDGMPVTKRSCFGFFKSYAKENLSEQKCILLRGIVYATNEEERDMLILQFNLT